MPLSRRAALATIVASVSFVHAACPAILSSGDYVKCTFPHPPKYTIERTAANEADCTIQCCHSAGCTGWQFFFGTPNGGICELLYGASGTPSCTSPLPTMPPALPTLTPIPSDGERRRLDIVDADGTVAQRRAQVGYVPGTIGHWATAAEKSACCPTPSKTPTRSHTKRRASRSKTASRTKTPSQSPQ